MTPTRHTKWPLTCLIMTGTLLFHSCGSKKSEDLSQASLAPVTTPSPTPTASPGANPFPSSTPNPFSTPAVTYGATDPILWLGRASAPVLIGYDSLYKAKVIVDLAAKAGVSATSAITAIGYLDAKTLIVTVRSTAAGNSSQMITLSAANGTIKEKNWHSGMHLDGVATRSIAAGMKDQLFVVRENSVENISYNSTTRTRTAGATGQAYIEGNTPSRCDSDKVVGGNFLRAPAQPQGLALLLISTGTSPRLNVIGSLNIFPQNCLSSYNYSTTGPVTSSADTPVQALQSEDGKVFVLYRNTAGAKVVRYNFDGTTLSAESLIMQNAGYFGTAPKGMSKGGKNELVVFDADNSKLAVISTDGTYKGFFKDGYMTDIGVLSGIQ